MKIEHLKLKNMEKINKGISCKILRPKLENQGNNYQLISLESPQASSVIKKKLITTLEDVIVKYSDNV